MLVCLSSSHIEFSSICLEPVFMIPGEMAATAASVAIDEQVNVKKVNYEKSKKVLPN